MLTIESTGTNILLPAGGDALIVKGLPSSPTTVGGGTFTVISDFRMILPQ